MVETASEDRLDAVNDQPSLTPMNRRRASAILLTSPFLLPAMLRSAEQPETTPGILEKLRTKHKLPALAVVVTKGVSICDKAAVGVRKEGDPTPVTIGDRFHIGSCTKSMTATLVAILIEDGKVRWDTTIAEALPELKGRMHPDFEAVTLEMLLRHRGGLPTEALPVAWRRAWEQTGKPMQQRKEFISAVLAKAPDSKPGTKYVYSNQGYAVAGAMLEKITGTAWETLMAEKLFLPLEMKTAGFGVPGRLGKADEPWGHVVKGGKNTPQQSDNPPAIGPGGTVHCSLEDLAHFTMLHLRRGAGDKAILKPESFRRLHTPPAGQDYACGWNRVSRGWAGGNALTHSGSNTMWFAVMWLAPGRDFSAVVGTNVAGDEAQQACDQVAAAMIGKWLQG